ncbi:MAG: hypothetical protein HYT80_01775 [Euryarchaeota archaeon]|nr:hypothetical protein [Euryarchaeota archaeon]
MTDEDQLTIDRAFDSAHRLAAASVNYRARIRGRWRVVGRYDTAHNVPHLHCFWKAGNPVRPLAGLGAGEMVDRAKRDHLRNWAKYRARMEANLS